MSKVTISSFYKVVIFIYKQVFVFSLSREIQDTTSILLVNVRPYNLLFVFSRLF